MSMIRICCCGSGEYFVCPADGYTECIRLGHSSELVTLNGIEVEIDGNPYTLSGDFTVTYSAAGELWRYSGSYGSPSQPLVILLWCGTTDPNISCPPEPFVSNYAGRIFLGDQDSDYVQIVFFQCLTEAYQCPIPGFYIHASNYEYGSASVTDEGTFYVEFP